MIDLAPADEPGRELLVTVDEAARRLSIAHSTLYPLIRRGELASVRIGRSRRIAVQDLDDFVSRLRISRA